MAALWSSLGNNPVHAAVFSFDQLKSISSTVSMHLAKGCITCRAQVLLMLENRPSKGLSVDGRPAGRDDALHPLGDVFASMPSRMTGVH